MLPHSLHDDDSKAPDEVETVTVRKYARGQPISLVSEDDNVILAHGSIGDPEPDLRVFDDIPDLGKFARTLFTCVCIHFIVFTRLHVLCSQSGHL